jgi:hypothetical protein
LFDPLTFGDENITLLRNFGEKIIKGQSVTPQKTWILNKTDVAVSNLAQSECCYSGIDLQNIAVETALYVLHIRVVLRDSARRPGVRTEFFSLFFSP